MDEVSQEIERIEKRLRGVKHRAQYEGGLADLEYSKRGKFMVQDIEWLITELKKALASQS